LRFHAPNAEIYFKRVAVTPDQTTTWSSLSAAAVRLCIEQHVDAEQLKTLAVAEQSEKEFLHRWAAQIGAAAP
jgi:hypothetical protein